MLRLLIGERLPSLFHPFYCTSCRTIRNEPGNCPTCRRVPLALNQKFWEKVSARIWRWYLRDPMLLARVKAEHRDLPAPNFSGPLSWITNEWGRVGKPTGRPLRIRQHYVIVQLWNWLTQKPTSVSFPEDPEDETAGPRRTLALGLSGGIALDVLSDSLKNTYKGWTKEEREELNTVRRVCAQILEREKVRISDRRQMQRTVRWVKEQRQPAVRLRGRRVRTGATGYDAHIGTSGARPAPPWDAAIESEAPAEKTSGVDGLKGLPQ